MISSITSALTAASTVSGAHVVNELPMPAWVYGVIVFIIFLLSLGAILSLRSVRERADEEGIDTPLTRNRPGLYEDPKAQQRQVRGGGRH